MLSSSSRRVGRIVIAVAFLAKSATKSSGSQKNEKNEKWERICFLGAKTDRLVGACHATAAVLIPASTTTHTKGERRCNFPSKDVPCLGHLHCLLTGGSVRTEPRKNIKRCLRRGYGKECPQYSSHGTKALIKHVLKDHEVEGKLVLAASSRSAQAKSQRAEAFVEACIQSQKLHYLVVPVSYTHSPSPRD